MEHNVEYVFTCLKGHVKEVARAKKVTAAQLYNIILPSYQSHHYAVLMNLLDEGGLGRQLLERYGFELEWKVNSSGKRTLWITHDQSPHRNPLTDTQKVL